MGLLVSICCLHPGFVLRSPRRRIHGILWSWWRYACLVFITKCFAILVEAEGLIHREPVRETSFNSFEQPLENEPDDLDHDVCSDLLYLFNQIRKFLLKLDFPLKQSIQEIEPDDEEFEGFISRKAESESGDSTPNKPLLKVAKVSFVCCKVLNFLLYPSMS